MSASFFEGSPELGLLTELCTNYSLTKKQTEQLRRVCLRLCNDDLAATTVRAPIDVVNRHIADSLSGLEFLPKQTEVTHDGCLKLVDIGSGAGVPALIIAVCRPDIEVVALDSVGKKMEWVQSVANGAELSNLSAVHGRAEEFALQNRSCFDVATFRAVAPLGVLLEYAAPLLIKGGIVVAWKGLIDEVEANDAIYAASQLNMSKPFSTVVEPFNGATHHKITTSQLEGEVPDRFPRRNGLARKKPLKGI